MLGWYKRWRAERAMQRDSSFEFKAQAPIGFGNWCIVELSGAECVILLDHLHLIHHSNDTPEEKGRNVMGLRYQAIAMSLRTKSGRIPLEWTSENDLLFLASFSQSLISSALKQIATLSDMPWLDPLESVKHSGATDDGTQTNTLTNEEISANPS